MSNEDTRNYYSLSVCNYISGAISSGKIFPVSYCSYYICRKNVISIISFEEFHSFKRKYDTETEWLDYAYKKSDVFDSSKRLESGKRKPISLKKIQELEQRELVSKYTKKEKEEADMPKEIIDTGVVITRVESNKYLSVEESKSFFKNHGGKIKTGYSWYEDRVTFNRFVAIDFYKNVDFTQADIDWLYTKYRYLYFAFEKNGSPIFIEELKTGKQVVKKGEQRIAQSSAKINVGTVASKHESSGEFLSLPISKRLWILSETGIEDWSWFIDGAGASAKIFVAPNDKANGAKFICKAYHIKDYEGLDKIVNGVTDDTQVKYAVNGYLYERRSK